MPWMVAKSKSPVENGGKNPMILFEFHRTSWISQKYAVDGWEIHPINNGI